MDNAYILMLGGKFRKKNTIPKKMNIEELRENLKQIRLLRNEIAELKKERRFGYSLSEYLNLLRNKISFIDHGEDDKFWNPMHIATSEMSRLIDIRENEFNSAFSKNKRKFLSIIDRYIKDLQHGIDFHNQE